MKRTPLWVFVAAVGVQIAALLLCVWAMENLGHLDDDTQAEPEEKPVPLGFLNAASTYAPAEAASRQPDLPPPAPPPNKPPPAPIPPPAAPFRRPPVPVFGPPPAAHGMDFILHSADEATQVVRGESNDRSIAFGFYPDGNIRFVDVDGGRYAGKAESARARMREVDGTRAFTVQVGVAVDGRLQATFTGGLHDDETLPLEPLVGWSVA